eukprot:2801640-Prymnesium_polylepis.1
MDVRGECNAGDRYRWQRAPARFACLACPPSTCDSGNPLHRSVCPRLVSQSAATTVSRTYINETFMQQNKREIVGDAGCTPESSLAR